MRVAARLGPVSEPEGPVWTNENELLVAAMGTGEIVALERRGQARIIAATGRPNGLALDHEGFLWVAESRYSALLKLDCFGRVVQRFTEVAGLPLLWPNDICIAPDGSVLFTDSGIALVTMATVSPPDRAFELAIDGRLLLLDPQSCRGRLLDRGLRFANGLALSPDAETLYVAETLTGRLLRYTRGSDGGFGSRQLFAQPMQHAPRAHGFVCGPDGMAVARDGSLLVALYGVGELARVSATGEVVDRLRLQGSRPTNVAYSPARPTTAAVTECEMNQILIVEGLPAGAPLFGGDRFPATPQQSQGERE